MHLYLHDGSKPEDCMRVFTSKCRKDSRGGGSDSQSAWHCIFSKREGKPSEGAGVQEGSIYVSIYTRVNIDLPDMCMYCFRIV